ncbi:MAG: hypothetical protein AAF485_03805 [Chloroflexota bacterium]
MNSQNQLLDASTKTADTLKGIAQTDEIRNLSRLSLPEIDAVVNQVAQVMPAGNVPAMILNGLARLSERRLPLDTVKRDIDLLFKGVEQVLDKAVYSAFFAGPAAVIWGYQNLLKLVGKGPEDAFPEGIWQFYVDYALREDTARHTNETHGFDTLLAQHEREINQIDRMTAWVMAAIHCLHQYPTLLENEWRERIHIARLIEIIDTDSAAQARTDQYQQLYRQWELQRPYSRHPETAANETYPIYRSRKFDQFLAKTMDRLSSELQEQWRAQVEQDEAQLFAPYKQQMSILAYLSPNTHGETRTHIPLKQCQVGIIYQGHYYLIPICFPNTHQPAEVDVVRAQLATIITHPIEALPASLTTLAGIRRANWPTLRKKLNEDLLADLDTLRLAPIIINFDQPASQNASPGKPLTLAQLRQTERGVGDHPLTLFDTGQTMVFDQSHIFFDGAWGAALAEIMTNEALAWAVYLNELPDPDIGSARPYMPHFSFTREEQAFAQSLPKTTIETWAETELVNVKTILKLRQLFKHRNDLLKLTVNDLLLLYRAIHAGSYQPTTELTTLLEELTETPETQDIAQKILEGFQAAKRVNPVTVIPVDASQQAPRERLYPVTFEVPLKDLALLTQHRRVIEALEAYKNAEEERETFYAEFDRRQRHYLATLAGFGHVLSRIKQIAVTGQSSSVGVIKLLAHLPTPLQRILDKVPGKFDVLNDIIKGREVFSNVGAVAPTSTLTRFITAKDDNDKKTLAWGVLTDAQGTMTITLRDFRPQVAALAAIGHSSVAQRITQDYLDAYAHGFNTFIHELALITQASRETQPTKSEPDNDE